VRTLHVSTSTTGRVLVEDPAGAISGTLIGCHGYGQNAAIMLEELKRIPGAERWRLVSVQALHRFYTRNDQAVVASWMTREDREQAIGDNIDYMNRVVAALMEPGPGPAIASPTVFLGFSQGASMAARAAVCGSTRPAGLIMIGGDIPSDVREQDFAHWPRVLIGCGDTDTWYGARVEADVAFLRERGVPHEVVRFTGGHEFTDEFRSLAGAWLARLG